MLRITIKHPLVCQKFCARTDFLEKQLGYLTSESPAPTQIMAMRTFCNMFKQTAGEKVLIDNRDRVITPSLNCRLTPNKNVQIALATLLLNYSVYLLDKLDEEAKSQCLLAVASVLENPQDGEAQFPTARVSGDVDDKRCRRDRPGAVLGTGEPCASTANHD